MSTTMEDIREMRRTAVAKAYVSPDEQQNIGTSDLEDTVANPLALNLYVLGYSNDSTLTTLNRAVKENLRNYLDQYRMLTDSINIRDAFVINIGVDFDIIPLPNTNGNEVVLRCIDALKTFFNIDRWQVNEPIVYGDIFNLLVSVEGVQTVTKVGIKNLNDSDLGYSNVLYNIADATKNGIIYPSYDPAIFEVKFFDLARSLALTELRLVLSIAVRTKPEPPGHGGLPISGQPAVLRQRHH